MLKLKVFTFNMFSENTIVIWDDITNEAAVIDPGTSDVEEENMLSEFISSSGLKIKFLINTHCHIDHILGCRFVKEKYNPIYYLPEKDLPLLENANEQAKLFDIQIDKLPKPDEFITEQTELFLGKLKLQFLFTPGHTPGEYSIYIESEKVCITGDVLFNNGVGRTDLWGGDYNTLINSIESKLMKLPDETEIYPGHGEKSTIGNERKYNPFLA